MKPGNAPVPPPEPPSPASAELAAAKAALSQSKSLVASLNAEKNEAEAALVRAIERMEVALPFKCEGGERSPSFDFPPQASELESARAAVAASSASLVEIVARLKEAGIPLAKASERMRKAGVVVAAEASEHNARQAFVLLPDALQQKIIDLLPIGR